MELSYILDGILLGQMFVWTFYLIFLTGELLHTIDTAQMSNGQVTITPCNDLVAAAGFTPEVHIWAVQFGKGATSSPFQQVQLYPQYSSLFGVRVLESEST